MDMGDAHLVARRGEVWSYLLVDGMHMLFFVCGALGLWGCHFGMNASIVVLMIYAKDCGCVVGRRQGARWGFMWSF